MPVRESAFEESCHCARWGVSSPRGGAVCPPHSDLFGRKSRDH